MVTTHCVDTIEDLCLSAAFAELGLNVLSWGPHGCTELLPFVWGNGYVL